MPTNEHEAGKIPIQAVYLAAGLSSRFGGRIKCLQEVGRHGETLLELSVRQLCEAYAAITSLVLVVSEATYKPIRALVGDQFYGLPVSFCFQRVPTWRKRPLGTVDALLAAREHVRGPFLVLNGDSLYGVAALSLVCSHIAKEQTACMPGYKLCEVLPEEGRVNRAIVRTDEQCRLLEIVEQYNIGFDDIRQGRYTGNELTSMNIFGFYDIAIFDRANERFQTFLSEMKAMRDAQQHQSASRNGAVDTDIYANKEYILSTMLNEMLQDGEIELSVLSCNSIRTPLELTNPGDFAFVKSHLDLVGL
jgi:molybdopterin-guanine dinucleotide biosynthesis protein A